jgi:MFS family permease
MTGFVSARIGGMPRFFWVLWWGTFVNRLGTMVLPFLAVYLSGARGLPLGTTGAILALVGAGQIGSQLIGGALTDRIGRRHTLAVGMLASAVSMLALGYARGVAAIAVTAGLFGLALDMFRPAAQSIVADLVPSAGRTRAYGLLLWAINLGFSIGMVLGGTLARTGFHALFWTDAGTCAVFGLLVWCTVPETGPQDRTGARSGRIADVLRDRTMLAFTLVVLAAGTVFLQAFASLPLVMRAAGLSPATYGAVLAVNGVVIVLVQPLIGPRLGRLDAPRTLAAGILVVGLGYGLTALATTGWEYAATVAAWTLGEILIHSIAATVVADLAPPHLRGRYNGLYGMAWGLAALLAPLAGTQLLRAGPTTLWLSCLGSCVAAAAGQLLLAPTIRRRQAAAAEPQPSPAQPGGDRIVDLISSGNDVAISESTTDRLVR